MQTQFKAKLIRIGGAIGITIPSRVAEMHEIGNEVIVTIDFQNAGNKV